MGYEQMSLSAFIDEMKEASTGPYIRKFCFVIGAGASKTSGIQTGQELVDFWDKQLSERNPEEYQKWKAKYNITEDNKHSFYNHYYEKRYKRNPGDGYNFLERMMENAKPSSGHVMLAHLLVKTDNNTVITTNFDCLLEDAVNYYLQSTPLVVEHESQAHYVTKQNRRATVVKIHRDLLFDRTSPVDQAGPLHENWKLAIDTILSEYHPIFIGYAGNDAFLMDYLVENSEKFSSGEYNCPYWMLYDGDRINEKVSAFLQSADGYVIKHHGFDEVLNLMGVNFGYRLPSKEEFLRDAENRYEMLCETLTEGNIAPAEPSIWPDTAEPLSVIVESQPEPPAENITKVTVNYNPEPEPDFFLEIEPEPEPVIEPVTEPETIIEPEPEDEPEAAPVTVQEPEPKEEPVAVPIAAQEPEPEPEDEPEDEPVTIQEPEAEEEPVAVPTAIQEPEPEEEPVAVPANIQETEPEDEPEAEPEAAELKEAEAVPEAELKAVPEKTPELPVSERDEARFHHRLAVSLHKQGLYPEAVEEAQAAVELEPDNAYYHHSLGVSLHQEGRNYQKAIEEMQKAVELDSKNALYHDSLGVVLHEQSRYEEAILEKEKAVGLEPENAGYHDSLGISLHEQGRYEEAVNEKQKAVVLAPNNADYHGSLGVSLHEQGRYEEAVQEVLKAVKIDPQNARYHDSLGVSLHKMGRYEAAVGEKQRAVDLQPTNACYHFSLGVSLHKLGRLEEAITAKQEAVRLEPENPRYRNSLRLSLDKLRQ